MKNWSKTWVSSKRPSKQRKYVAKAPLHIKSKFVASHLSADLRKKYKFRALRIRKGDKVKIMRGSFRGKTGKVERLDIKKSKVYITGIELVKKDGSKSLYPIHSSNLLINELNLSDKRRIGGSK